MSSQLHLIKAVVVASLADGARLISKCYAESLREAGTNTMQCQREQELVAHVRKNMNDGVHTVDSQWTACWMIIGDAVLIMVVDVDTNIVAITELLYSMTNAWERVVGMPLDARRLMERLDLALAVLDEMFDGGIIMETEVDVIEQRLTAPAGERSIESMATAHATHALNQLKASTGSLFTTYIDVPFL